MISAALRDAFAVLCVTPLATPLLAIIVLLLKSKKPDPAETRIPDRE